MSGRKTRRVKRIALIAEYDPDFAPHTATDAAVKHSSAGLGSSVATEWVSTKDLTEDRVRSFDGLWIAPGSHYKNLRKTLNAIRFARESAVPLLGTCGGFQHVILEYARNVLDFSDAHLAEYDPYASRLFISELACSLAARTMEINLVSNSGIAAIYGKNSVHEQYYCNFGVNPDFVPMLLESRLNVTGSDREGEVRIVSLSDHPFYYATLFVPQMASTQAAPHPLVSAFLLSVLKPSSDHR
jgi:CTP synthase (UTP-ammonia lyase)